MNRKIFTGLALSMLTPLAMAAQTSANVTVSATIPTGATCTVQTSNTLDLGEYSDASESVTTSNFDILCDGLVTSGTVNIVTSRGTNVGDLIGNTSEFTTPLQYGLYVDSAATIPFGPTSFSIPESAVGVTGEFTVKVPAGEITRNGGAMQPGVYFDTVQIMVDYF